MWFYCFASSLFSFADIRLIVGFPPLAVICTGIVTSDYSTIRTTFRQYLFLDVAQQHLSKRGGEWSFKLRRQNVQRRSRPPPVIYPTTTSRLLPLVAPNIRVMASFDAVIKGERSSLLSLGKLHQQCHVVFIYSTAGPFQLASSTNGVALHLSWVWKCSTERRSRYRGAPGDHSWIMVDDRVNKGNYTGIWTKKMWFWRQKRQIP